MTMPKRSFKPEGPVIEVLNRVSGQLPRDDHSVGGRDHGRALLDQLIDESWLPPDMVTIREPGKLDV
jgi:hypothetical protein